MTYPIGPEEERRLAALRETGLLDSAPDPAFDALRDQVRAHFGVPICLVTLVDRDRLWAKSECGLGANEAPRHLAFCTWTILSDAVFVIEDTLEDERFRGSPLVTGGPRLRFYAGAPLVHQPGIRLGALCVLDTAPRRFTAGDRAELAMYADRVAMEILRHGLRAPLARSA